MGSSIIGADLHIIMSYDIIDRSIMGVDDQVLSLFIISSKASSKASAPEFSGHMTDGKY